MGLAKAEPGKTRVGWIGTGVMGRWMCQHLIQAGYKATVYNRTKDKAQPLADLGAVVVDSPGAVAAASDVVFAIVGFPKDVREVFLGADGVVAASKAGNVVVDMTTSEPSLAVEIAAAAKAKGAHALDAPVSGGDVGAKNAALSIMIGGDTETVDAVKPLFEAMGKTIVHQGGPGAGQHTKMVNQILISSTMVAMCRRARSPMTNTFGDPGSVRSGSIRTRPAGSSGTPSARPSGEAATPAAHSTVAASM